jgi:uncharacterized membrane protein
MTRQQFINQLRNGLAGLPAKTVDEIAADYETHFSDGAAAGRSEIEVADALGDPTRLARELRAEAGLKRWETERNASAAAGAVFAVLGLGAIDILVLLPILLPVAGTLLACFIVSGVLLAVGAMCFAAGPFWILGAPIAAILLVGIGLMALAICLGAVTSLVTVGLMYALVWYGRLHLRLLKPALEPEGVRS